MFGWAMAMAVFAIKKLNSRTDSCAHVLWLKMSVT